MVVSSKIWILYFGMLIKNKYTFMLAVKYIKYQVISLCTMKSHWISCLQPPSKIRVSSSVFQGSAEVSMPLWNEAPCMLDSSVLDNTALALVALKALITKSSTSCIAKGI